VGAGFKGKGVFADDLSGNLDQVYSVLIRDQQGVATQLGAGADFAAARKLVQTRKELEGQAMLLFGKDMNKSILPKLTSAATGLTKGEVAQFKNLMEALPKNMRTPAAATLLNDLFTHGARTKGSLGQGFATAYRNLNTHAGAKRILYQYLPKDARKRFDALGIVSTGLFRAKALENTSRTARDILLALDSGTLVTKVTGAVARPAGGLVGGFGGAMAGDVVAGAAKAGAKRGARADELMSSPSFNNAINKAMEGRVKEADTMLKANKLWQAWRNTLGEGTRAQLTAQGPIAWLTAQAEQQQPEPPAEPLPAEQGSATTMPPVGPPAEALAGVQ
jgi:hypothetical protein